MVTMRGEFHGQCIRRFNASLDGWIELHARGRALLCLLAGVDILSRISVGGGRLSFSSMGGENRH